MPGMAKSFAGMISTAATDKVLYSPTSPVGTEGSEPSPAGDPNDPGKESLLDSEDIARITAESTEPVYQPEAYNKLDPPKQKQTAPCPVICIGPRFDKEYQLNANRWAKIGRSKKAQLLLNNTGVSRNHCSLRWDRHRQVVELKDGSTGGTLINGEVIKGARRTLQHADRIRIEGKATKYDFLLDLRPVNLALTDPREEGAGPVKRLGGQALVTKRDALKAQLSHLEANIEKCDKQAFEKEREFYEIATRRSLRTVEDKQRSEELQKYLAGAKELELRLQESRAEWLEKLQVEHNANDLETRPLMAVIGDLQVKVEKLQLKKDELERSIHPEKYAVADVSRVGSFTLDLPGSQKTPSQTETRSQVESGVLEDGEEDAFADLLAGVGGGPSGPKSPPTGAEPTSIGDEGSAGESLPEPEAKRRKVDGKEP